jgi:glutamine synthetase adenylyltransferase
MTDIEFLAQMLQLKFGRTVRELRQRDTNAVLSLGGILGLESAEVKKFSSAYRLFRELEKLLRITLEEKGSILPEGRNLDILARCYDRSTGDSLRSRVNSTMNEVRAMFLGIARRSAIWRVRDDR